MLEKNFRYINANLNDFMNCSANQNIFFDFNFEDCYLFCKPLFVELRKSKNIYEYITVNVFIITNKKTLIENKISEHSIYFLTHNFEYFIRNKNNEFIKIYSSGNNFENLFETYNNISVVDNNFKTPFDNFLSIRNSSDLNFDIFYLLKNTAKNLDFFAKDTENYQLSSDHTGLNLLKNNYWRFRYNIDFILSDKLFYRSLSTNLFKQPFNYMNNLSDTINYNNNKSFSFNNIKFFYFKYSENFENDLHKFIKYYIENFETWFLKSKKIFSFNYKSNKYDLKAFDNHKTKEFTLSNFLNLISKNMKKRVFLSNDELNNIIKKYLFDKLENDINRKTKVLENSYNDFVHLDVNNEIINLNDIVYFIDNHEIKIGTVFAFKKIEQSVVCIIKHNNNFKNIKSLTCIDNKFYFKKIINIDNMKLHDIDLKTYLFLIK